MDNCSILNENVFKDIQLARGITSFLIALLSLGGILFTICKIGLYQCKQVRPQTGHCCTRYTFHTFLCNPFLWLAFSSMLSSIFFSLNLGQIDEKSYCQTSGYFTQAVESIENWTTLFFAIYFVVYISCKGKPLTDDHADMKSMSSGICYVCHSLAVSFVIILLPSLLSFSYNLISVIEKYAGGSYGNSGPWCWIEGTEAQLKFWYAYLWSFQIVFFPCFIAAILIVHCGCKCCNVQFRWKKLFILALTYSILFIYIVHLLIGIIESVVRLDERNDCSAHTKNLWYTYAISTPVSKFFLVAAALVLATVQSTYSNNLIERSELNYGLVKQV